MSKFLRVPDGDYKVEVQPGGRITLDTGTDQGQVRVTGDLIIEGDTTTVQSINLTVSDNIIVVNAAETGNGITLDRAGLQIERGNLVDAFMVFDERIQWAPPGGATQNGAFTFVDVNDSFIGLRVNSITTGGGDLGLIGSGTGVITVSGTTDYEKQVFYYTGADTIDINGGPNINGVRDSDYIPNAKSISDYINSFFAGQFQDAISEGLDTPTQVEVRDFEITGTPSEILFTVDNNLVANFFDNRLELNDLRISGTKIETTNSNEDLVLSAPGTGAVRVQDVLGIYATPSIDDPDQDLIELGIQYSPLAPESGVNLYTTSRGVGGSGILFVHEDETRDEIISNNRALVYSMLF